MEYLLCTSITLTLISIYMGYKVKSQHLFDKIIMFFLIFILFHFVYRLIYEVFNLPRYIDTAFPFGLVYGPMLYFALNISFGRSLSIQKGRWHLLPFFLALIVALCIFISPAFREAYYRPYIIVLFTAIPVSFLGYMIYAIFASRSVGKSVLYNEAFRVFSASIISLLCLGLFFLVNTFTRIVPEYVGTRMLPPFFIYSAMAGQVIAVILYQIDKLIKKAREESELIPVSIDKPEIIKYQKSLIPDETLNLYEKKLEVLVQQKIFRNSEISVDSIAKEIGAPKHHVTQLINIRKGENFNQYINKLRISYACSLLRESNQWTSIEELAYECGFNSKVSFNRNFKNIVHKTPTEYRQSLKLNGSI